MIRRILFLLLLPAVLFISAFHAQDLQEDFWRELERGLELCNVETITYESYCFVDEGERELIRDTVAALPGTDCPGEPGCSWSVQGGYENGELLLRVCGTDRAACSRLWDHLDQAVDLCREPGARAWVVEAYLEESCDLAVLGEKLVSALGGQLRQLNTGFGAVQLLAYLPWAGEGFLLDRSPVNLNLELYEDTYLKKIKIRLGIPVLLSL